MLLNAAFAVVLAAPPRPLAHLELDAEATPAATVRALAASHPAVLGFGPADRLRDLEAIPLRRGTLVKARRTHQGFPVIGQSVMVRLDERGHPIAGRTDFRPLPALSPATVTAAQAIAAVAEHLFGVRPDATALTAAGIQSRLVVDPRRASLVWAVHVSHVLPHLRRTVLVHARTGEVVEVRSPVRHAADDAAVYLPHPSPDAILGAPEVLTLERLTPVHPQVLEGEG